MRDVDVWQAALELEWRSDGTALARSPLVLPPYPDRITDCLVRWAGEAPERLFLTGPTPGGGRTGLSYADVLARVRRMASALKRRPLSRERPILILSGNDLDHALLGLGALYAGIPYAPVSTAYSLLAEDTRTLRRIAEVLTPGLVFAADGAAYARAIAAVAGEGVEVVVSRGGSEATVGNPATGDAGGAAERGAVPRSIGDRRAGQTAEGRKAGSGIAGRAVTLFSDLLAHPLDPELDLQHAAIRPDDVAKILFTSGSTGAPKGVINTHRMLASNQAMIATALRFLTARPPVIVDWLPWNHTFGGNHNFGIALYHGGTYHIDPSRPIPAEMDATARLLGDVSPTVYFNVPRGYEALVPYLCADSELAHKFFSRLECMFVAGAGLSQAVWGEIERLARSTVGDTILMMSGIGATETSPSVLFTAREMIGSGAVGLPVPGLELKLVPTRDKLEVRVRGTSVTPGYWRQSEATAAAFDGEGFYRLGDALRFVDAARPELGFLFDGRLSEDFKLGTGTWVSVGALRARVIEALRPLIRDAVIVGVNRDDVGALLVPDAAMLRALVPDLPEDAPLAEVVAAPAARLALQDRLERQFTGHPGSSGRIARILVLTEPLSLDLGEVTDKGSVNQREVLRHRVALADSLYADPPPDAVIVAAGV
ncbi:MAG: feruloyl-CoA synthase [Ancalomicrobiaceae bacterium]|nr:feruloyl-CoA synthase [Ancalomicrobiaceae bacterium]